jgi:hypothetical protein
MVQESCRGRDPEMTATARVPRLPRSDAEVWDNLPRLPRALEFRTWTTVLQLEDAISPRLTLYDHPACRGEAVFAVTRNYTEVNICFELGALASCEGHV